METYYISAYIDNELDLDEKITFVHTIHDDKAFKNEALDLLLQEQRLRGPVVDQVPTMPRMAQRRPALSVTFKRWGAALGWGLAMAMLVIVLFQRQSPVNPPVSAHRFVIYQPDIRSAEIVGSFSNWKALRMQPSGSSGYWEITVTLPPGEYRYSFLLDDGRRIADPTSRSRERDDFGGVNSIITVRPDSVV